MMIVDFVKERDTKNTVRFMEDLPDELATPKLGVIYVPKQTLREIGWSDGKKLRVELQAE